MSMRDMDVLSLCEHRTWNFTIDIRVQADIQGHICTYISNDDDLSGNRKISICIDDILMLILFRDIHILSSISCPYLASGIFKHSYVPL